jgi:uncharacterized membrane protein SirB2
MTLYQYAKIVHVCAAAISIAGFVARFALTWRAAAPLHRAWRVPPHINDTILLAAALTMLASAGLNPFKVSWLSAKIAALFVYIGCGMVALRPARSAGARLAAFFLALLSFAFIVAVAWTRNPRGLLAL